MYVPITARGLAMSGVLQEWGMQASDPADLNVLDSCV